MDERELVAQVEGREEAVRQLKHALDGCREADLTPSEILAVVRPLLLGDDGILIGTLVEHLSDGEASTVIRIIYGGLPQGATLSFVSRRTPAQIHALCEGPGISSANVTIDPEGRDHRVAITKLQ